MSLKRVSLFGFDTAEESCECCVFESEDRAGSLLGSAEFIHKRENVFCSEERRNARLGGRGSAVSITRKVR